MGYVFIEGEDIGDVRVYSLSTCAWCDKLKELLRGLGVRYSYIDLDTADEQEREEVLQFLDSIYEKWGFPALLFKDTFLVCGYNEKSILQTLGLEKGQSRPERHQPSSDEAAFDEKVEKTFETIRRFNEKKGYYLNPDTPFAKRLVRGLLENQEKYGYWACPCRLASGIREEDRDIICPCVYREPDVREFGGCYCGLFVSEEVARGRRNLDPVPERRPKAGVLRSRDTSEDSGP